MGEPDSVAFDRDDALPLGLGDVSVDVPRWLTGGSERGNGRSSHGRGKKQGALDPLRETRDPVTQGHSRIP